MGKSNVNRNETALSFWTVFVALCVFVVVNFTGCKNAVADNSADIRLFDKIYTVDGIKFTMKAVDAVTDGSVGHKDNDDNNVHTVNLTAYYIAESEVTQELWYAVMGNKPSYFDGTTGKEATDRENQKKRPVEKVNWYHAITFCNKLSIKCGLEPCYMVTVKGVPVDFSSLKFDEIPTTEKYAGSDDWNKAVLDISKNGFRLPTEAEWEWAAKGGKNFKWTDTDDSTYLNDYAWYKNDAGGDSDKKTHAVKMKKRNGYGLYDMSGNVWEWCHDWYEDPLPNPVPKDHQGAADGTYRVVRGGGLNSLADFTTCSYRLILGPGNQFFDLGLRIVRR